MTKKATFTLPDDDIDTLRRLAREREMTVTATLRRAIATEAFLEKERQQGSRLLIEKADGKIVEIVIIG